MLGLSHGGLLAADQSRECAVTLARFCGFCASLALSSVGLTCSVVNSGRGRFLLFFLRVARERAHETLLYAWDADAPKDSSSCMMSPRTSITSSWTFCAASTRSRSMRWSCCGKYEESTVLTIVNRKCRSTCGSSLLSWLGRYLTIEGRAYAMSITCLRVSYLYLGMLTVRTSEFLKNDFVPHMTSLRNPSVQKRCSGRKNCPTE